MPDNKPNAKIVIKIILYTGNTYPCYSINNHYDLVISQLCSYIY